MAETKPRPAPPTKDPEEQAPTLERLQRDQKPEAMESAMMSGSDEGEISATERFEGELSREEALEVLDPEGGGDAAPE